MNTNWEENFEHWYKTFHAETGYFPTTKDFISYIRLIREKALTTQKEEIEKKVEGELGKYKCGKHKKLYRILAELNK